MESLSSDEASVGRFYDGPAFDAEVRRLSHDSPVECAITRRWLDRYAGPNCIIVEAGVGGGHYSEFLARKGCIVHLVDVSERLLEYVSCKLRLNGLGGQVAGCHHSSAADMDAIPANTADLVLLLGPLYHLRTAVGRARAVAEAARILMPGGILLSAGVNRLAYLRDLFRTDPTHASARAAFHERYLCDGNLDPEHAPPVGWAHTTTAQEFRALFMADFEEIALTGIESFAGAWQTVLKDLPGEEAEAWLDLVERTGCTPEGLGQSDHFLFAGRKK